jgi:hypothetical protein
MWSHSSGRVRSGSDVPRPFHLFSRVENYFMFVTMVADYFSLSVRSLQRIYIQDVISKGKVHPICDVSGTSGA